MKKYIYTLIVFTAMILNSCTDKISEIFTANSPIYMSYGELRSSVRQVAAQELVKPGKMYFKDNYIFIIEQLKGIHIIDNSNPASPQNISFIEIPGAVDMAIKNNVLYADSYVDLIALDLSDLNNIEVVYRSENVLPYLLPPYDENYPLAEIDHDKGVVVDWEIKKVKQKLNQIYYPVYNTMDITNMAEFSGGISNSGTGVGGSMARFGIKDNTLYIVDNANLHIYNISNVNWPALIKTQNIGWNIESMFILDNYIFFGTTTGMLVFNISVPQSPMYISNFWHITSCDPVVVKDTLAFITLRDGNNCNSNVNELEVISIKNIAQPYLVKAYPMVGPYGLGIDGNMLFVCDGTDGLKVYDTADPTILEDHQIAHFPGIFAYDVIPLNGNLLLIGEDGFYQYSYSGQSIQLLSKIEISGQSYLF